MQALLDEAHAAGALLTIPRGVLGQAWRGTPRQARARLLGLDNVTVDPLDETSAKAAGVLCGRARTSDVIDASVVIAARLHDRTVVTSDPDDLRHLDPQLRLMTI
jgi:predicted nucleic acid-binding protein